MNKDLKQQKINRFINDEVMATAVHEVIRDSFLKKKGQRDVYVLAAERLALDLLEEAWKDLSFFKELKEDEQSISKQVGL